MFEYKDEHRRCDLTNITHSDHYLTASIYGWDFYSMNESKCYLIFTLQIGSKSYYIVWGGAHGVMVIVVKK